MKYLTPCMFCLLFCLIVCYDSDGQANGSFDSLGLVKRQKIEKSLVLLKNDHGIVPITRLDTVNMKPWFIGDPRNREAFLNRIFAYKEFDLSDDALKENYFSESSGSDVFIIGIDSIGLAKGVEISRLISHLETARNNSKVILVVPSFEWIFQRMKLLELATTIIYNPTNEVMGFDLAVQAAFGAIGLTGTLKAIPDSLLPKEATLTSNESKRLKYTIAEEVGISSYLLDSGITKIVQEGIDSMAFPGCQVLVAKSGKVIYQKSFGFHTYAANRPVTNNDIYDLASVSKVTGATTALMKLYDDGLIDLDAKFSNYWPDFKKGNKKDITVRNVLAHNARLKPYITYYLRSRRKSGRYKWHTVKSDSSERFPLRISSSHFLHKDYREKKIYKMIRKSPLNEEPGYVYSGLSFYLYPEIVSRLSDDQFADYLNGYFFHPLGGSTLGYNPSERFGLERIVPTETDDFFRMEQLHGTVHDEGAAMMGGVSGNAGLFSNANDLAKIWQMYLNEGYYGGKQYLSKATVNEFTRCQFCDQDNRRGLGFDKPLIEYDSLMSSVARASSPRSYGHSGYTGAFVWADPENEVLFVFLSNRVYPTRENRKIYEMNIRPRIHTHIYSLLP